MKTKLVIASRAFSYGPRDVVADEEFEIDENHEEVLIKNGSVRLPESKRDKRAYKRRDMVADDTSS